MPTVNPTAEARRDAAAEPDHADVNYRTLAEFRFALRKFLAFSEAAAADAGLTSQQHQALLAVKGFSEVGAMSIRDLAARLLLRHHSVVELIDRLVKLQLVARMPDPQDGRRVLIGLTDAGERHLRELSAVHLRELRAIGSSLSTVLNEFRLG